MNLILLEPRELTGETSRLEGGRARHVREVLRAGAGDTIRIGLVGGPLGTATLERVDGDSIELRCSWAMAPPVPRVDLLLALPRPKVLRRLWPQLAALGTGQIMLTNAERVERHYFDTHLLDEAVYRPLLIEGLQQARDTHLPGVSIHRRLKVLVEDELDRRAPVGLRLMADPAAPTRIADAVSEEVERVLLAVGPEGGWNDFERRLLIAHGFVAVGLGPRPLRSDTACVALLALVHDAMAAREREGGHRVRST